MTRSPFRAFVAGGAALAVVAGLIAYGELTTPAQAQIAVKNQGYVPFTDAPIFYRTAPVNDPVALLQQKLEARAAKLELREQHGYLKSILDQLNVPIDSQTLVFSKTSFQLTQIDPAHPRALYFNDDIYVGSVHDGKTIEIVSFDPVQGAIFYLVDEPKAENPKFQRAELDCTQCHIAPATRGVPGVLLRSVYPRQTGALAGGPSYITDQKSPLKERWGGWYVSGDLAKATMANAAVVTTTTPVNATPGTKPTPQLGPLDQPYTPSAYLAPGSDAVALLVLGHQVQMHNVITLTNYQTRIALHALGEDAPATLDALPAETRAKIEKPAEQLLRHLLFSGEAPLGGIDARKTIADSDFAQSFAARGVRDSKKRSLRDFDLHDRIFAYPCSYLIYNAAFDGIPEPARGYIYHRLLQVLSGEDQGADFANLSTADRQAILSILIETKPGLPAEWLTYAQAHGLRTARANTTAAANQTSKTKGR